MGTHCRVWNPHFSIEKDPEKILKIHLYYYPVYLQRVFINPFILKGIFINTFAKAPCSLHNLFQTKICVTSFHTSEHTQFIFHIYIVNKHINNFITCSGISHVIKSDCYSLS